MVAKRNGVPTENLMTLASTGPDSPRRHRRPHRDSTRLLAKKIQTALVDMDKTEAATVWVIVNSKKGLTGHVVAEDSLFDVVRRTAKTAGM